MNLAFGGAAAVSTTFAVGAVLYRTLRPRLPVTVECWFCCTKTKVPYGNQNCWDCPACEQYNGFTPDGGYNKSIPAQTRESLNHSVCSDVGPPADFNSGSEILCNNCGRNQSLKIRQLANFIPYEEDNFEAEADRYKKHLDQVYQLCVQCSIKVKKVLQRQETLIRASLHDKGYPLPDSPSNESNADLNCTQHLRCQLGNPWHVKLLRSAAMLCALTVLLTSLQFLLVNSQTHYKLANMLPKQVDRYIRLLRPCSLPIIMTGGLCTILAVYASGKERLYKMDAVACISWLIVLVLYTKPADALQLNDLAICRVATVILTTIFTFWGALRRRYVRSNSPIKIRKRKLREPMVDLSELSDGEDEVDASLFDQSPPRAGPSHHPLENELETINLGTPSKSPKKKKVPTATLR